MNNKKEKFIIIGPSGSGKDFLIKNISNKGLKAGIKWTTRPKRESEEKGIDYNYVDEHKFKESINSGDFLVYQKFIVTPQNSKPQVCYYGLTKDEFNDSQLFIMTPGECSMIPSDLRKKCFVIYLDIERKIREKRLILRRDKNDSIKRRLNSDDVDFKDIKDYDLRITDPEFNADDIYNLLLEFI
jgi:guanylate kinase